MPNPLTDDPLIKGKPVAAIHAYADGHVTKAKDRTDKGIKK